ncbi:MAG: hypothetical protein HN572_09505, partial [Kordiimonadaceae bacterium]|nr:hypothetical protein [Kordiimonadaceae bacterium]
MTDQTNSSNFSPSPLTTSPFNDDKFHDECGVFGVFNTKEASTHTVLGLHALQHRGQEAAGIVSQGDGQFYSHKSLGHVADNFNTKPVIESLPGTSAIGHV